VFAAGAVAIVIALVVVLSQTGLRRAGYNYTAVQGEIGQLPVGATGCQPEAFSRGTRGVIVHGAPLAAGGHIAVRIRIEGEGRFDGTGAPGYAVGTDTQTSGVAAPLPHGPPPPALDGTGVLVTMCVINTGTVPLALFGAGTGSGQMVVTPPGGAPATTLGRIRVDDLLSARPQSLWGVLPRLPGRIEAATGSPLAPWLVGIGAVLALVSVVALLLGAADRRRPRVDLAWVAALTLATGALWAGLTPAFQKTDEPAHFAYVQTIATLGHPPQILDDPNTVSGQLSCWMAALAVQRYRFFETERPPWDDSLLAAQERQCDPISAAYNGAQYQSTQPPAYYFMAAGAYELASGTSLPTQMLAVRLFSVLLAAIAVVLTYLLVREVIPGSRWPARAAALALALQPIFMFNESGVNSDALVVAVTAAIAYLAARSWRRGLSWRRALALGALTGLGILSKLNFLTLVPSVALLGAALWWSSFAHTRPRERLLGALRVGAGAGVATAIYGLYVLINNDVWHRGAAGQGAALATGVAGSGTSWRRLADFVWQFFLPRLPGRPRLFPSYYPLWNDILKAVTTRLGWWNDFGFDGWAPTLVVIGLAIAALAAVYVIPRARRRPWPVLVTIAAVGLFLVALVVADYQVLGGVSADGFEGRYVFPAMPIFGLLVACAVAALPARFRPAMTGLLAAVFLGHTILAISSTTSVYYL
jgi:4-amino-4-deoxy-L-arabinose transferase-like glycosyltransferase